MKTLLKKYWPLSVLVALVILTGFREYGHSKYRAAKKQELTDSLASWQDKIVQLKGEHAYQLDTIQREKVIIQDYYNEYVYEYNRRIEAESQLHNIVAMRFDKGLLDSLAEHYRFRLQGDHLRTP